MSVDLKELSSNLDASISDKFNSDESVNSSSIKARVRLRAGKRQSVTKTINAYESKIDMTIDEAKFFLSKLDDLNKFLKIADTEIETFMLENNLWSDREYDQQSDLSERYSDSISKACIDLKSLIELRANNSNVANNSNNTSNIDSTNRLRLPDLDLPTYSGVPEEFDNFITSFESIVNQCNISSFQKYKYLCQSCKGYARLVIQSVPSTRLDYDYAKQLLTDAFSSELDQKFSIIDRLIKVKVNNPKDFFGWVSEVKILSENARRLNIDRDTFFQYFVWKGMSGNIKKEFITITKNSEPSFDEILDSAYTVRKILVSTTETSFAKQTFSASISDNSNQNQFSASISDIASDVDNGQYSSVNTVRNSKSNKKSCQLCLSDKEANAESHNIFECKKYDSPVGKLNKIKKLNGCTRCGYLNHITEKCTYKFKGKCFTCKEFHAYFLCTKTDKPSVSGVSRTVRTKPVKASSNNISVNVMNMQNDSVKEIIPSLTFKIQSKKGKKLIRNRVMYDTASEMSFISKSALAKVKNVVVSSGVNICINGFNDSKNIVTDVVKLETNLNGQIRYFNATVIPEIRSKIRSSFFNDVKKVFKTNNITLADDCLGDEGTVDILLGIDYAHILPTHSLSFGHTDKLSMLHYCAAGIMVSGDMENLIVNSEHLPIVTKFMSRIDDLKVMD